MSKAYQVTGPLATPYREDGTRAYLYQGAPFGPGLREGEVERFLDLGLIAETDAPAQAEADEAPDAEVADPDKAPADAEVAQVKKRAPRASK